MPKKRTSTEASRSNDEQTAECSTMQAVFQHEDNTKHAKLVSLSDTTLQDLPMELLECILVKAVAMELKGAKLAKIVWKEKAKLVIKRLKTVSVQWSSILTTNCFRTKLHRTLDGTAQDTICLEVLPRRRIQLNVIKLATMNDEIFMLYREYGGIVPLYMYTIDVYNRNNMAAATDVIPLSEIYPREMVASSVSNCVYVLYTEMPGLSITRITRDDHQFRVSPWIKNPRLPDSNVGPMSVSPNGNLVILSRQQSPEPIVVGIYDANGFVQHRIRLSPAIYGFRYVGSVIQKSNGNLVLDSSNDQYQSKLLEIDMSGRIIHEYQPSLNVDGFRSFADICGNILIKYYAQNKFELLDSEFKLLNISAPRLAKGQVVPDQMHYNSKRNELVGIRNGVYTSVLTVLRIIGE